jgi:hypothetical protein
VEFVRATSRRRKLTSAISSDAHLFNLRHSDVPLNLAETESDLLMRVAAAKPGAGVEEWNAGPVITPIETQKSKYGRSRNRAADPLEAFARWDRSTGLWSLRAEQTHPFHPSNLLCTCTKNAN